jgi:hypothetical protein
MKKLGGQIIELLEPRRAKVVIGGGDLRFAQVDVPLSISHACI